MRMRWFRGTVAVLAVVALLAGCGGKSAPEQTAPENTVATPAAPTQSETPAQPTTQAPPEVTVPMSMGSRDAFIYLQPLLAEQLGYFKNEGINIEAKTFKGGTAVAKALASGEVKFAHMALDHVIRYGANDMVALVVYNHTPGMVFMVDPKYQNEIKDFKDLKGKKLGITTPGSGSHNIFLKILVDAGLKPEDVEFVPVGFDLDKAFAEGKVVAGYAYDPLATAMVQSGKGVVFADLRGPEETQKYFGGEYPITGLVTTRQVLQNEPQLVERVVRAIAKANDWLNSHSAEDVAQVVPPDVKGQDEALYITALNNSKAMFDPDGLFTPAMIDRVVDALKLAQVIPSEEKVDARSLIDTSFASRR